ncbi:DUF4488 domain-containing protein [Maribacter sp. 4G9]|uniref:DUF4488 domain-containing protein n=1 Tax=Maribacter sp. 4G9 TaxID=1889777 RepID=UPI000C35A4F6|nr:DUF4488 domain-containing protein [Maribacter sp. 4G9]PIB28509.1 hypothetical protein BFP75_04470 [Maribacter sp. 4G9]
MKKTKYIEKVHFVIFALLVSLANAQISSGVYLSDEENIRHELKIDKGYLTHTIYKTNPAEFVKTLGGFYSADSEKIKINLEFNSDFGKDSLKVMEIPYSLNADKIMLQIEKAVTLQKKDAVEQDLDGQWLFATPGPDTGQERRGEENPRKTLKFLLDGRFQWIAYQTETMAFSGTGGGSFTSVDGVYTENIEFFSRDNNRVGANLEFNYEIKGDDWHHTGNNSRGEPMYEIWSRRN